MIKVEHISKQFKKVKAVDDVSLEVKKGEIVCLIGPSGSGKSTVLRCIHGLEVPETGHVYLNGEVLDPKKSNYQELRNKMGFVFQHFNLFPHMTVLENLTLSLTKVRHMEEEKANEIACNYLTRVGLLDKKDEKIVEEINVEDKDDIQPIKRTEKTDRNFDYKKNKKLYALHHVSFPGSYQIDLFYSKNNCYLIAIEVNTRYLFITRTNINVKIKGKNKIEKKSTLPIFLAMQNLFEQGWNPSIIRSDSESAFNSNFIKRFIYDKRKIIYEPVFRIKTDEGTSPNHTSLAIVDRVIRTIKDHFYDEGYGKLIPQKELYKFVSEYNKRPHKTLTKLLNNKTSPEMVHNDIKLEIQIIERLIYENNKIKEKVGWQLPPGTIVKVMNDTDALGKRRRMTKIDPYEVVKNHNNLYIIRNTRTGEEEKTTRIKISRN